MNVMDYENSKRFRRNKLEEDDNISDNEMENEEWDEGFGAEEFISFDEELPEYDENNPTPTCFSRWYDIQKYYYHGKIPLPIQLPKEDKKQPKQHPLKWANFTDETEIESTMVVIGKISGTVLSVNSATLTVPPATATTIGGIEMLGDLTGSVATAPTIAAGAITLAKMANLSGTSQLHGSSSTTTSPANISLGSTLQMSGTTLSVNTSTLMLLVPSSVNGDLATLNASGQVIDSGVSINNSGLTSASLWNAAKLAVTTNSWFAGTNPNTTAPTDRPATSNVLYVGTDASLWIWNGTLYISLIGAKVPTATTRTFTTSTGASGFQISSTNGAFVYYSVSISTTIGVGGTSTGTVNLEVSPTNSATPASWIVNGSVSNSQSLAGLLTLTSIQVEGAQLSTYVPAGYFVKLRTISSGTTSFTYVSGIEVLDN